ncbi:MAG: hypothetical protein AAB874_01630 [Patescibacteria group bacterium]
MKLSITSASNTESSTKLLVSLLLLGALFLYINSILLLKDPPVWPDESIYADVVTNLIRNNRFGTDFWLTAYPGAQTHTFWNPPLFFVFLYGWFRVFGITIVTQRFLSITAGFLFLVVFTLLNNRLLKPLPLKFRLLPTLALILDNTFMRSTRISRPEIFVMLFGYTGLSLYLNSLHMTNKIKVNVMGIICGVLCGLTLLIHLIGAYFFITIVIFHIIVFRYAAFKEKFLYFLSGAFILPLLAWLTFNLPHLPLLFLQNQLAVVRKSIELPWIWYVLNYHPRNWEDWFTNQAILKIVILFLIGYSTILLLFTLKNKSRSYLFFSLLLGLSWLITTVGKMSWYFPLIFPAFYILFLLLLKNLQLRLQKLFLCGLIAMLLLNSHLTIETLISLSGENYSYLKFTDKIVSLIPESSAIFLSTIPDPYYGLINSDKKFQLYEFPALQVSWLNYFELLNNADYIVYNGTYNPYIFGTEFERYILLNRDNIISTGESEPFKTMVIKLLPKNQRIDPIGVAFPQL